MKTDHPTLTKEQRKRVLNWIDNELNKILIKVNKIKV